MIASFSFLLALLVALLGQSDKLPTEVRSPNAGNNPSDFLASLRDRVAGIDALSFEVELHEPYVENPSIATVAMAKGERFRVEITGDNGEIERLVVSDGRFITEYVTASEHCDGRPAWTQYGIVSPSGGNALRGRLVKGNALWMHAECWVGENSALSAQYERAVREASEMEGGEVSLQKTTRDDAPVWQMSFSGQQRDGLIVLTLDYDIYFSAETLLPVFRRMHAKGKFLFFLNSEPSVRETIYRNMKINPMLPDSTFEFTPPADAVFIDPEDDRLRRSFPIGREAPALELATVQGDKLRLSEFRGERAVLMSFWSTWCAPCLREMPTLIKLHDEFHAKGLRVIGVSLGDELTRVKSFVESRKVPYTVVHDADRKAGDAFMVHGIPCTILIDKQGIVRRVWSGWSGEEEEKEIREALAEVGVGAQSAGKEAREE